MDDRGASRTSSAVGSRGGGTGGGGSAVESDRSGSSKRTGKLSNRATMDSKPSSRRPSFEKKNLPTRASFESKAYTLPIVQALTGLNVPAYRLAIFTLPELKLTSSLVNHFQKLCLS